jgi:hypothetical protein
VTNSIVPVVLIVACTGCVGGLPPRYAESAEVRASAQRSVVVGVVTCEDLWQRHGLEGVVVQLFAEGEATPLATTTSARDGAFALTSGFVAAPERPGQLRISGRRWTGVAQLVALDQTYSVAVTALCGPTSPQGSAMLRAIVSLQPIPTAERFDPYPLVGGRREFFDINHSGPGPR